MIPTIYYHTDAEETRIIREHLIPLIDLARMKRDEMYAGQWAIDIDNMIQRVEKFCDPGSIRKNWDEEDMGREYPFIGPRYPQPFDKERINELVSVAVLVYFACSEQSSPEWWYKCGDGFIKNAEHLALMRKHSADALKKLIKGIKETQENHHADIRSIQ